ncbi:MAG: hypothetical protein QW292_08630 [Candidatus Parvarchaeota archaeon]
MSKIEKIFRREEEGVAGAITVVLVIALVAVLLSYYVTIIVPSTMSQYEFTMDQGLDSSILQFSSDVVSLQSTGTIGAIDFQNFVLESGSIPIFSPPSYASLSFISSVRNGSFSYFVNASDSITGLPVSFFYGGGGMLIANGNRFYDPGFLFYEAGAVYQVSSLSSTNPIPLSLSTILEYSPGTNTYYFNLYNIYGTAQEVTSGSVNLEIEYSGTSQLSATLTQNLPVYVGFSSPDAAEVFLKGVTTLFPGAVITPSHLGVKFVIPSGVNVVFSVSSYAISEYGLVK